MNSCKYVWNSPKIWQEANPFDLGHVSLRPESDQPSASQLLNLSYSPNIYACAYDNSECVSVCKSICMCVCGSLCVCMSLCDMYECVYMLFTLWYINVLMVCVSVCVCVCMRVRVSTN